MTAVLIAFALLVVGAVVTSLRRRSVTGREGLVGAVGEVRQTVGPSGGTVMVGSELWRATSSDLILTGQSVVVLEAKDGLVLRVRPQGLAPSV
jgi:membrane-bound serine protease (ClpP class)